MKKEERDILDAANAGDLEAIEEIASGNQPGQQRPTRRDEEPPRRGDRQKERRIPKRTLTLETNTKGEETMKTKKTPVTKTTTPETTNPTSGTTPINTNAQPPKPQFIPCPLCGHGKSDEKFLVCKACNDRYSAYVDELVKKTVATGKDQEVLSKIEWVLSQLDLARFERELDEVRQKRTNIHERMEEKVYQLLAGQKKPLEYIKGLIAEYEKKEGDELYFQVRRLNSRLQAAAKLKPDLERTIAEKAAQAAAPTAEPTPGQEETMAEAPAET